MPTQRARLEADGTMTPARGSPGGPLLRGRVDGARLDATTEAEIAAQAAADEAAATRDVASYARRVRRRVGLSQAAFAARIGVPLDTVRNWEQGKRLPAGPAMALLRILDRAPETALAALG